MLITTTEPFTSQEGFSSSKGLQDGTLTLDMKVFGVSELKGEAGGGGLALQAGAPAQACKANAQGILLLLGGESKVKSRDVFQKLTLTSLKLEGQRDGSISLTLVLLSPAPLYWNTMINLNFR